MTDWRKLTQELDCWADRGLSATLWWRDDDAALPDPALDRLLGFRPEPLALAVIPKMVHEEAAAAILARSTATVIQHGYGHRNYAPPGEGKSEYSEAGDADIALDELVIGRKKLEALFGDRFEPILAPPWNRLAESYTGRLVGVGLSGLSAYGPRRGASPAMGITQVNSHIDLIDWRGSRGFVGEDTALGLAIGHLAARRTGAVDALEPTGLLSHHLVHDAAAWRFIEDFMDATGRHGAARWLTVSEAFRSKIGK